MVKNNNNSKKSNQQLSNVSNSEFNATVFKEWPVSEGVTLENRKYFSWYFHQDCIAIRNQCYIWIE